MRSHGADVSGGEQGLRRSNVELSRARVSPLARRPSTTCGRLLQQVGNDVEPFRQLGPASRPLPAPGEPPRVVCSARRHRSPRPRFRPIAGAPRTRRASRARRAGARRDRPPESRIAAPGGRILATMACRAAVSLRMAGQHGVRGAVIDPACRDGRCQWRGHRRRRPNRAGDPDRAARVRDGEIGKPQRRRQCFGEAPHIIGQLRRKGGQGRRWRHRKGAVGVILEDRDAVVPRDRDHGFAPGQRHGGRGGVFAASALQ